MTQTKTNICKCGLIKEYDPVTGLHKPCKPCVTKYNYEYYHKNKDELLKQCKLYQKNNPLKQKSYMAKYYRKKKESLVNSLQADNINS